MIRYSVTFLNTVTISEPDAATDTVIPIAAGSASEPYAANDSDSDTAYVTPVTLILLLTVLLALLVKHLPTVLLTLLTLLLTLPLTLIYTLILSRTR